MRVAVLLSAMFCLVGCASMDAPRPPGAALLATAIDAAGGEAALRHARVLAWEGDATVHAGERRIELEVATEVEPFVRARSDSWLRSAGRSSLRTLEVDATGGWTTRDGTRAPMDPAAVAHERAQFAVYGLMRLLDLREPGVRMQLLPADASGHRGLRVQHPLAPAADLYFDGGGRLAYLLDRVPAPDGTGEIAQRFEFEGSIEGGGVRWPRTLRILQDGRPYFELRLRRFAPRDR
jgi:hypothetical protein